MIKVLVIKTSSMGDVIHTLPALTDASREMDNIEFHWVVEKPFSEIPSWHANVTRVIPIEFRKWRKGIWRLFRNQEWRAFKRAVQETEYDYVIDAQGLLKSAFITLQTKGPRIGLDFSSAREHFASFAYQRKIHVNFKQHAVKRARELFAKIFDYEVPNHPAEYGIDKTRLEKPDYADNYFIFLHGTTWETKHWPVSYWCELAKIVTSNGYQVLLPWGNETERVRAEQIASNVDGAQVLPKLNLSQISAVIAFAKFVIAVDTGLGHMAAAMAVPTISLYGPTNPKLTGTEGLKQTHLAAKFLCAPCLRRDCNYKGKHPYSESIKPPCFGSIAPQQVWEAVESQL